MKWRGPYRIPPANALVPFESAARHGNFTEAARELRISQPAVSRQIDKLERWLSVRLFERSRTGVTLTDAGECLLDGVAAGLAAIQRGAAEASALSDTGQVVIACSHEASHFFFMPRYDALRRELGEEVRIRILTYHHYIQSLPADPSADILMTWDAAGGAPEDRVVVHMEAVRPVCSPAYADAHARTLAGPVAGWSGLTFSRPAAAQRGLGVVGGLVRGRRKPGPGAAPPRTRQLHLRPGSGRRRAWHRAGLAGLHRAAAGIRRTGRARRRVRRIRPCLLRRAHRAGTPQAARAPVPRVLRPVRIAPRPRRRHQDRGRAPRWRWPKRCRFKERGPSRLARATGPPAARQPCRRESRTIHLNEHV